MRPFWYFNASVWSGDKSYAFHDCAQIVSDIHRNWRRSDVLGGYVGSQSLQYGAKMLFRHSLEGHNFCHLTILRHWNIKMAAYKLSKNGWVMPFFVIFSLAREKLLVTVAFDHPVDSSDWFQISFRKFLSILVTCVVSKNLLWKKNISSCKGNFKIGNQVYRSWLDYT